MFITSFHYPNRGGSEMSRKDRVLNEIEETTGPMNSVAKHDAKVYAEQHAEKYSSTDRELERMTRAKKRKIQRSTTKHERFISKLLKRYF